MVFFCNLNLVSVDNSKNILRKVAFITTVTGYSSWDKYLTSFNQLQPLQEK